MKTHRFFFLLLFFITCIEVSGQVWPKIYNHTQHHTVRGIVEDYDHGYLITGQTFQGGVPRWAWLKKTDVNGVVIWEKVFGSYAYLTYFNSLAKTSNNETLLIGATTKYDNDEQQDPIIVKLDLCGDIEWCTVLDSEVSSFGTEIIELSDGSFVALLKYYGNDLSRFRISLVKLNEDGVPIWIENLAQQNPLIFNEEGYDLVKVSDENYIVSGHCFPYPNGLKPYWISSDSMGQQKWEYHWENGIGTTDESILYDDNTIYSIGSFQGTNSPFVPCLFKISIDGQPIGNHLILGDTIAGSEVVPLVLFNDTLLFSGIQWRAIGSSYEESNSEAILFDTSGAITHRKHLIVNSLAPHCATKTYDNKLLLSGTFEIDEKLEVYLWKMNEKLDFDTAYTYPFVYDSLCSDSITSGTVEYDCNFIVKVEDIPSKETYDSYIKVFPNPATSYTIVYLNAKYLEGASRLDVFDMNGRLIRTYQVNPKETEVVLDIGSLPNGVYNLILVNQNEVLATNRLIKQ